MARLFITGTSGYVGSNLTNHLKAKNSITIYNRNSKKIELESIDIIIHLAGLTDKKDKKYKLDDYICSNYKLTKEIFDHFLKSDVKVFIYLSSIKACSEYSDQVLTENIEPRPEGFYGISKLKAEEYIMSYHPFEGKKVYILRPPLIYGKNNLGNLSELLKYISLGLPWPFGNFNNKRSFCSIENLIFGIDELLKQTKLESGIYNIADDDSISTNDLVKLICQLENKQPRIWNIPIKIIFSFARVGDFFRLPFNSASLNKVTKSLMISNSKIKNGLKIEFPIKSRNGIINHFQSLKKC